MTIEIDTPPWNADDFLPHEVAQHLQRRGIRTDGLGLIQNIWGIPILLTDPAFSLLTHRRHSRGHIWAGTIQIEKYQFKVILVDNEIKTRKDWRYPAPFADAALCAEQIEGGTRSKVDTTSLNEKLVRFSGLYDEWQNHFGYMYGGMRYNENGLAMMRRKEDIENEMDSLTKDIIQELEDIEEK